MEKLIFPVSVTQKEQLSGVFIFDFEKSAFLAHPNSVYVQEYYQSFNRRISFCKDVMEIISTVMILKETENAEEI